MNQTKPKLVKPQGSYPHNSPNVHYVQVTQQHPKAQHQQFADQGSLQQNQGAYMQVKTLEMMKPVETATFNVIYQKQKQSIPQQHFCTLNSMRQVLNQIGGPQQTHHQQQPQIVYNSGLCLRSSHDRTQARQSAAKKDTIVVQQSRHPNAHRQSQYQQQQQVLIIPQSAVMTAHQQLVNQQMQARSNQNSAIARNQTKTQELLLQQSSEQIKPQSSQQQRNCVFPSPSKAVMISQDSQNFNQQTSFRQHNSRSIAQLGQQNLQLIETQKFKGNDLISNKKSSHLKEHRSQINPKDAKLQMNKPSHTPQLKDNKNMRVMGGASKIPTATVYHSSSKEKQEPYILIQGDFGAHVVLPEEFMMTETSPRHNQLNRSVPQYNFIKTQGQMCTQDYMQVIKQRCENRGIIQNCSQPIQTNDTSLKQTPRKETRNFQVQNTAVYAKEQSISSTTNEQRQDNRQSDLSKQNNRRRSIKAQTQAQPNRVNNEVKSEIKPKDALQTQEGIREKKAPLPQVNLVKKNKEPEKKPETLFEKIFNAMKPFINSVPLPPVSAEAWCVYDTDTMQLVTGKLVNHKRECASLTKMMTFLTAWSIFTQNFPELTTISIKVPKYCAGVNGTSAFLRAKDTLTMHQLFYAMLLPSGNDASLVLADFFGTVLMNKEGAPNPPKSFAFEENLPVRHFLKEMNIIAKKLGMNYSVFDSPHGLANSVNVSTAQEMAILSHHCMQNELFCEVVKTPFYIVETELAEYEWQNTNRLLGYDFDSEDTVPLFTGTLGCKTGITPTAGPCFAGCFSRYDNETVEPDNCIVIVLGSKSMEARWVEVPALVKWYQKVKSMAVKALNLD